VRQRERRCACAQEMPALLHVFAKCCNPLTRTAPATLHRVHRSTRFREVDPAPSCSDLDTLHRFVSACYRRPLASTPMPDCGLHLNRHRTWPRLPEAAHLQPATTFHDVFSASFRRCCSSIEMRAKFFFSRIKKKTRNSKSKKKRGNFPPTRTHTHTERKKERKKR
jgi:hypothetical protein